MTEVGCSSRNTRIMTLFGCLSRNTCIMAQVGSGKRLFRRQNSRGRCIIQPPHPRLLMPPPPPHPNTYTRTRALSHSLTHSLIHSHPRLVNSTSCRHHHVIVITKELKAVVRLLEASARGSLIRFVRLDFLYPEIKWMFLCSFWRSLYSFGIKIDSLAKIQYCVQSRFLSSQCVFSSSLSVCLPACEHLCLPASLSLLACLPACLHLCLCLPASLHLYLCLPLPRSACICRCLSACLHLCLCLPACISVSACLPISLSACLHASLSLPA